MLRPDDICGVEDWAVGAGEVVAPGAVVGGSAVGVLGVWGVLDFDDAGLAGGHAAGHGLFEADLAIDVVLGGKFGDGVHHGMGAAGVDDCLVRASEAVEGLFEVVGDEAFMTQGTIVCGDEGFEAETGELMGLVVLESDGQEVFGLCADKGGGLPVGLMHGVCEVEHWGEADASADEKAMGFMGR